VERETKSPPRLIYRVARMPDAWAPLDWSLALPDGTFGNRFDDPESEYRVLYASSQEVGCFVETLARFRSDLSTLAAVKRIHGEDDFTPPGEVPPGWELNRALGTARAEGSYADICGSEWLGYLRPWLATECVRRGIPGIRCERHAKRCAPRDHPVGIAHRLRTGVRGHLLPIPLWK
jgi:RES domain